MTDGPSACAREARILAQQKAELNSKIEAKDRSARNDAIDRNIASTMRKIVTLCGMYEEEL